MSDWPDGFMWGTGASSTQTEGASPGSDWMAWEEDGPGAAVRRRQRVRHPARRGLRALRRARPDPPPAVARVDPARADAGPPPREEVERYRRMLQAGRDAGVSVWVCLHHFTLPGWFADDLHGFRDDKQGRLVWSRHVDWVAETFGDLVAGLEADQRADVLRPRLATCSAPSRPGAAIGARPPTCWPPSTRPVPTPPASCARRRTPVATVESLSRCSGWRTPRDDRGRRRPDRRALVASRGRTTSSSTPTTTSGSPTTPRSASAATARSDRWPVDGAPGPQGYVRWAEGFAHVLDRLAADHPGDRC